MKRKYQNKHKHKQFNISFYLFINIKSECYFNFIYD